MRILMTTDTIGGIWTYCVELAGALQPHGVEVALATLGSPPTSEQHEEAASLDNLQLYPSTYKLEWMSEPWEDVQRAGEWLLRLEKTLRPDVVHLNGYALGALPWEAPVVIVGHSCVLSWWEAVKGEPAPESWERYRAEVTLGLQAADVVIAPSATMLRSLEWHYGSFDRSEVVPNGRDSRLFRTAEKKDFVFTAGRIWDEAKNVRALEQAAPGLAWPVYLAGEEEHPEGGTAERRHLKLLGKLSPAVMPFWYARAPIYALPARYEPFGLSALEAALSGCALVLGDIPSLREVWGDAAVYVQPDDSEGLVAALNALIDSQEVRGKLAARARSRALAYSPQAMAERYLQVYQSLAVGATVA